MDITIVMTTWLPPDHAELRYEVARVALNSWNHLIWNDPVHLHIADDGTAPAEFKWIEELGKLWMEGEVTYSRQERRGVGASLNAGLAVAFQRSPIVLHAVDDWELLAPFDLAPWVSLMTDPDYAAGMVRFFPHPDLSGQIKHTPYGHAMRVEPHHFAFATRPALWHQRMFEQLGPFAEGQSALETERLFNYAYCTHPAPVPIYLALPPLWRPIDSVILSELVPPAPST